jgi:hypothetical protein
VRTKEGKKHLLGAGHSFTLNIPVSCVRFLVKKNSEAYEDQVLCPRPYSWYAIDLGFEPKLRVLFLLLLLLLLIIIIIIHRLM